MNKIKITELFTSIQGESTYAGELCTFVRLTGCNLRCTYCDTTHSYEGGEEFSVDQLLGMIEKESCSLVEITGGEPLLQSEVATLSQRLVDEGYTVLMETNGSMDISVLPEEVIKIIDVKTPDSGAGTSFLESNIEHLTMEDELKFVLTTRKDYEWAKEWVAEKGILNTVIFSASWEEVELEALAKWIVDDRLPVRLGVQIHKVIWDKDKQGV